MWQLSRVLFRTSTLREMVKTAVFHRRKKLCKRLRRSRSQGALKKIIWGAASDIIAYSDFWPLGAKQSSRMNHTYELEQVAYSQRKTSSSSEAISNYDHAAPKQKNTTHLLGQSKCATLCGSRRKSTCERWRKNSLSSVSWSFYSSQPLRYWEIFCGGLHA